MKKKVGAQILVLLFFSIYLSGAEDFSQEKAFEHLKYIVEKIGPRPIGSPNERAALEYVAQKLSEFGCEISWQNISQSKNFNTKSANVVGRLQGASRREIIIGAHIDSSGPEIPGANDDASGIAILIELGRVYSQKTHYSTLVFVAFCGEESGLVGSHHFVKNYPLENVALMLQLDMASNDSPLMLWLETRKKQTPRWLVKASIEAFHSLGYRKIEYPTHFQSLNSALGGAGSDHQPFLEMEIPAIAFVSDIRFPIHTRNDSLEYFRIAGLERSGRLTMSLIDKFDRWQPEPRKDDYMLLLLNEKPIFIGRVFQVAFIIISFVFAGLALFMIRKKRKNFLEEKKIKWSCLKLASLLLLVLVVLSLSDWMMRFLKGQKLYWYASPTPFLILIFPMALLGIWVALRLRRKLRIRRDAFFYLIRAASYFSFLIIATWTFAGPRLALYPSSGLLLSSLACLVPWANLKGILWLVSPFLIFRLFLIPQYHEFVYRGTSQIFLEKINTNSSSFLFSLLLLIFIFIFSLPFLLSLASVRYSLRDDLFCLKKFSRTSTLLPLSIFILGWGAYLLTIPSYSSTWEQVVYVNQIFEEENNRTYIEFKSGDFLKDIGVEIGGKTKIIDSKVCIKEIDYPLELAWIKNKVSLKTEEEENNKVVDLNFSFEFEKQPFDVTLKIECNFPFTVEKSNFHHRKRKNAVIINWYSFPPLGLKPSLTLKTPKKAKLKATISASFLQTPLLIRCKSQNKHFIHRAIIKKKLDLKNQI